MEIRIWLGMFLALGLSGVCVAAGNGIYQRESETGAVELSNLVGDDEAQVVVAPTNAEAAAPVRAQSVRPAPVAAARAVSPREKREQESAADQEEEAAEDVARTEPDGGRFDAERQTLPAADTWAATAYPAGGQAGSAFTGGMASAYMPATNASSGGTGASGPGSSSGGTSTNSVGTTGSTPANSGTTANAGGAGNAGGSTSRPTSTTSVLDSPEALAARLAQYRDLMVNAPLAANGQPSNPAVVRRYRMVNRAGYWAAGW